MSLALWVLKSWSNYVAIQVPRLLLFAKVIENLLERRKRQRERERERESCNLNLNRQPSQSVRANF